MSGSVNKVVLIGRVGKDPEIRTTQSGDKIATLSVATSETWRDKATNERKERVEWHRVVIFNDKLAEVAEQYVKKGALVYIEGANQTRKWTDSKGVERFTTEVVLKAFNGQIQVVGGGGNGGSYPPPADSPDDYGTMKDAVYGAESYQSPDMPF